MRSAIIGHVPRILLPIRIAYLAGRRDHQWALLGIGSTGNLLLGTTVCTTRSIDMAVCLVLEKLSEHHCFLGRTVHNSGGYVHSNAPLTSRFGTSSKMDTCK